MRLTDDLEGLITEFPASIAGNVMPFGLPSQPPNVVSMGPGSSFVQTMSEVDMVYGHPTFATEYHSELRWLITVLIAGVALVIALLIEEFGLWFAEYREFNGLSAEERRETVQRMVIQSGLAADYAKRMSLRPRKRKRTLTCCGFMLIAVTGLLISLVHFWPSNLGKITICHINFCDALNETGSTQECSYAFEKRAVEQKKIDFHLRLMIHNPNSLAATISHWAVQVRWAKSGINPSEALIVACAGNPIEIRSWGNAEITGNCTVEVDKYLPPLFHAFWDGNIVDLRIILEAEVKVGPFSVPLSGIDARSPFKSGESDGFENKTLFLADGNATGIQWTPASQGRVAWGDSRVAQCHGKFDVAVDRPEIHLCRVFVQQSLIEAAFDCMKKNGPLALLRNRCEALIGKALTLGAVLVIENKAGMAAEIVDLDIEAWWSKDEHVIGTGRLAQAPQRIEPQTTSAVVVAANLVSKEGEAGNPVSLIIDAIMKDMGSVTIDGSVKIKILGQLFHIRLPKIVAKVGRSEDNPRVGPPKIDVPRELLSFTTGQCFCLTGKCAHLGFKIETGGSCYAHLQCASNRCDMDTHTCLGRRELLSGRCFFDKGCEEGLICRRFSCRDPNDLDDDDSSLIVDGDDAIEGKPGGAFCFRNQHCATGLCSWRMRCRDAVHPEGLCPVETGGTCRFIKRCRTWRNATCEHNKCVCGPGTCAVQGACQAQPDDQLEPLDDTAG